MDRRCPRCDEAVEVLDKSRVVIAGRRVDREHTRRVSDPEHALAGELPVHVSPEGRDESDFGDVGLAVEHGLVKVRDAPPQRDVE
ncbi:unannotated protein [freshwater metagenome]|uniref:Unannotated protein n=1 Tax=freshwater metagenome TaxID=449393 RepID=A0A6J6E4C5_9ZZZZ